MQNRNSKVDGSTSASLEQNGLLSAALSVEEGNKLIAEFMGERVRSDYMIEVGSNFFGLGTKTLHQMEYHSSWDWQVPAFGKIALAVKTLIPKLPNPEKNGKWYFRNLDKYEKAIFNNEPSEGQKVVVELLKWYNDNAALCR